MSIATEVVGEGGGPDAIRGGEVVVSALSDRGTERERNEDSCGVYVESPTSALAVVADGVSGYAGGDVASRTAVDVMLRAFRESPVSWGPLKRVHRAAQQANIEIHDRALVVTELRRMSTTLTAVLVSGGILYAAHVGDSRLYLIRDKTIVQKTKDHTLAADRARIGLSMRPKGHPDRSTLTRSLGTELIAGIDRVTFPLLKGDVLVACTDGLHNVMEEAELLELVAGKDPDAACRTVITEANARGTGDNVTIAVMAVTTDTPEARTGWRQLLGRIVGR
ncbi:MAG TPA: protein phosphatase 2C domain-containing protein [Polyangiaceae bacterium]|jgi:protein phosphatase